MRLRYGLDPVRARAAFVAALALVAATGACTTTKPVPMGIQPEYEAINPSRILAVPVFSLPDPARPREIDGAVLAAENGREVIERNVLAAFRDQPGVNGVSFQAVRDAIGPTPNAWSRMDAAMKRTAGKLTSTKEGERASLSKECLARKSFLDFYVHCLAREKAWTDELNELSARILNADTALLTVITSLEKRPTSEGLRLEGEVAVLVVDTNSGKLIWGRQARDAISAAPAVPEVGELFPKLLGESFWAQFPGRRSSETPRESTEKGG